MRLLIIGTDDDGRSAIDRIEALDEGAEGASPGLLSAEVWASASERGALATRPPFRPPPTARLRARRGQLAFVHHAPGASIDVHRTISSMRHPCSADTVELASEPAACCSSQATWCSSLGSPTAGWR